MVRYEKHQSSKESLSLPSSLSHRGGGNESIALFHYEYGVLLEQYEALPVLILYLQQLTQYVDVVSTPQTLSAALVGNPKDASQTHLRTVVHMGLTKASILSRLPSVAPYRSLPVQDVVRVILVLYVQKPIVIVAVKDSLPGWIKGIPFIHVAR